MRHLRLAVALCVAGIALGAAPAAEAAVPITSLQGVTCPTYGDMQICSGEAPSFDGARLDFDLTKPMAGTAGPHPLIVMLHGFGNNKREWESTSDEGDGADKWHWNSHWFAEHGYYVLTYTARGFCKRTAPPSATCPPEGNQPPTPSTNSISVPNGTIHLKSREWEIRDTQWLAALTAASFSDVDPRKVAVTGGSYGGGESWLQASQAQWTFPHERDQDCVPSAPPSGHVCPPVLDLQVSVPKYPWTDLAYSAAPNGHPGPWRQESDDCDAGSTDIYASSQGCPYDDLGRGNPFGIVKASYIAGLYALGRDRGVFEDGTSTPTPSPLFTEGPTPVDVWLADAMKGEPYDAAGVEDPVIADIRRGFTEYRASYYQDEGWKAQTGTDPDTGRKRRKVAIFSIEGWQDDLFEAVESFRQFKFLKRLDPRWPVALGLADVGHSRAQNNPAAWRRLNAQAWELLQSQIGGSHEQQTTVYSEPTICANDGEPDHNVNAADQLTATSPEGLSNGKLVVQYDRGQALTFVSGDDDPNGEATDPVLTSTFDQLFRSQGGCRTSPGPPPPDSYHATSQPLPQALTYVGLGHVTVPYKMIGTTAQLDTRVWDVPPGPEPDGEKCKGTTSEPYPAGCPLLVTRGTYRIGPVQPSAAFLADCATADDKEQCLRDALQSCADNPSQAADNDCPTEEGTLTLPLFGNHWNLKPGHKIRIDLTEVDKPFLRPTTLPNSVEFDPPSLTLPTRQSGERTLTGS